MQSSNTSKKTAAAALLAVMLLGVALSAKSFPSLLRSGARDLLTRGVGEAVSRFEGNWNAVFSSRKDCRDLYGLLQRALFKKEARNFEVLRSETGQLYLQDAVWPTDEETLTECAARIALLRDATETYGGIFVFVQMPYKNAGMAEDLKYYSEDGTEAAEDRLLELLAEKGIKTLDLRKVEGCSSFYYTDHHWTVDAAFHSSRAIAAFLTENCAAELGETEKYGDLDRYALRPSTGAFLGSIGIKVGSFYTKEDVFTVYEPLYPTRMSFDHYVDGTINHHSEGSWWETMIEQTLLDDADYKNKYNSLMYGDVCFVESAVENALAENELSALCVTHSYGRGMCAYLSQYFARLYSLDPQAGRYNGSILQYIREHEPEIVIFAYNDLVNVS